jgi:hypothetical protein
MAEQEPAHEFLVRRQSPAIVEYVVTNRPRYPSTWRIWMERLFYLSKVILIVLIGVLLTFKMVPTVELFVIEVISLVVLFLRPFKEEKLLVLQSLGLQVSSSGWFYWITERTRFIPKSNVLDIVIHEAFRGFEIRYILAIMVLNEEKLEVVFSDLLPRRTVLEKVWRGSKDCLSKE